MTYQLIAFDMDGTLLNSDKLISESILQAIEYATSHNKYVCLSTGRCLPELYEYLDDLKGVRYLICVSGGYVYDVVNKNYIYTNCLPEQEIEKILDISKKEDCMVHILNDLSIVRAEDGHHMARFQLGVYQEMFDRVTTMVDDIYDYYHSHKPVVMKLNLYHTNEQARERSLERLSHLNIEVVRSEKTSTECSNKGVTKGKGLIELCHYLNIDIKETIAVGDGENDIDILKTAGLAIAMDNAKESVKAVCDVVVSDNDHNGCVEAIYDYLMK